MEGCEKGMKKRDCQDNLKRHLMTRHKMGYDTVERAVEMEAALKQGRLPY
jgi:hypothetical protein